MPIYDYECDKHGHYEVYQSITAYNGSDPCPSCGVVGSRIICAPVAFIGASVQSAEYNPGLGCVTRNAKHRSEIAKKMGVEEVGSEPISSLRKTFTQKKQDKEKSERLSDTEIRNIAESWR